MMLFTSLRRAVLGVGVLEVLKVKEVVGVVEAEVEAEMVVLLSHSQVQIDLN